MNTKKTQELEEVNKVLMEALKLCIDENKDIYIDAGPYWLVKARAAWMAGYDRGEK
jgi:hypothetical protein